MLSPLTPTKAGSLTTGLSCLVFFVVLKPHRPDAVIVYRILSSSFERRNPEISGPWPRLRGGKKSLGLPIP